MEILIALISVISLFFLLMGLRALILGLGKSRHARVRERLKAMDRKGRASDVPTRFRCPNLPDLQ